MPLFSRVLRLRRGTVFKKIWRHPFENLSSRLSNVYGININGDSPSIKTISLTSDHIFWWTSLCESMHTTKTLGLQTHLHKNYKVDTYFRDRVCREPSIALVFLTPKLQVDIIMVLVCWWKWWAHLADWLKKWVNLHKKKIVSQFI